ncbi:quinone oxidoreductase family protein [Blastochloris viridis]|uniref:Quinone oxidoreductase n=1 Tax=Blastochloris viridis TaxID=1079 RepID=A0A0H5BJB5_BLAVI|nr:quinone oxidoreductase [Blastochloris viridis]ALK09570.1 Quinone oxidoreductase 1 [Blastochloris viridis]BAS00542.1 quinone oxidoreductase [Blastochloris viridis]CUU42233.1 Quinone oxidoreductase 1 [Blastochloris viridis]
MTRVVRVHRFGGPEVLTIEGVEVGDPGAGEARVRHTAIGLNFVDTYYRSGLYQPAGGLPFVVGGEGAGVVEAVGPGVTEVKPGDRVGYVVNSGAYSEARLVPAERLIKLPDDIDDRTAAAALLKGMTAAFLLKRTFKVGPGHTILFHAAAGGVGLIACNWAAHLGATVIGTVGSRDKAELAKAHGCHHVILYREEDFVARVAEITSGANCDVVYDSVGKATFPGSLDCIKPFGLFVSFGNASGPVDAFNLVMLSQRGSLYATRPSLFAHIAKRADLEAVSADLFDAIRTGVVTIEVNQTFPLAEARRAHEALEGRETTGATLLIP